MIHGKTILVENSKLDESSRNVNEYLLSPSVTENVTTGGIALWYTGCYINGEDACLLDQMDNKSVEDFETVTFPDSKAITVKNITVRLQSIKLNLYLIFLIIPES